MKKRLTSRSNFETLEKCFAKVTTSKDIKLRKYCSGGTHEVLCFFLLRKLG